MNEETGRKTNVLLEIDCDVPNQIDVWADKGMVELIANVSGVCKVGVYMTGVTYRVTVDKRYDVKIVGNNIIAAIEFQQKKE
jgi:hypothetical protein